MAITSEQAAQIQNNLTLFQNLGTQLPTNQTIVPSSIYLPPVNIQQIDSNIDNSSTITSYNYPLERPKYYMFFGISTYSRTGEGSEGLLKLGTTTTEKIITLPLPQQLVDSHQVDYEETALGTLIGGGINTALGDGGRSMIDTSSSKNTEAIASDLTPSGILNSLKNKGGQAAVVSAQIASELKVPAAKSAVGALSALTGYAPNQFLTILLKGPKYKHHQFTWTFSPRNPTESENLRRIIFILNSAMAPTLEFGGAIFGFPKIFRMGFFPNPMQLYRFKPAILENFTVDYTGNGQGPTFYRNNDTSGQSNAPETIAIRATFLELEFWLNRQGGWEDSAGNDFSNEHANIVLPAGNQ